MAMDTDISVTIYLEVCHPRCVVYNNVLTCKPQYLVNTTVFIYLCVLHEDR